MSNNKLWKEYKENNSLEAKDQLITKHSELVRIIAGRLYSKYHGKVTYDDLLGYGVIGLIDAINKYDYTRDVKFRTYASIRIRGAIIDQIRSNDWVPRSVRSKHKRYKEAIKKLSRTHGNDIDDKMIAKELKLSLEEYYQYVNEISIYSVLSLEKKIEENVHFDLESDYSEYEPEKSLEKKELLNNLEKAVDRLNEREKRIVQLYYYSELTYKEISRILDITESRISQIHSKIIEKLKLWIDKGD